MSSEFLSGGLRFVVTICLATVIAGMLAGGALAQTKAPVRGGSGSATPSPSPTPLAAPAPTPQIHESLPGVLPVFTPSPSDLLPGGAGPVVPVVFNNSMAKMIADAIRAAGQFCAAMPSGYRGDCMSERLGVIASMVPRSGGGEEVRKVLNDTAKEIGKIVRENRDPSKPRVRASTPGPNPVSTTRPLVAVRPEAEAAVVAGTASALEGASDLLLRSAAQSQAHVEQYQTIANALDSTALLLRS